ncbi:uncharacterized protein LOC121398794 [Xenopus laevis]|uniref:ribonuclease H n=1 Tax=Xenopus laevis TaxID=8355 RepID=A0A8J1LXC9_XENLA|nr:uncharacterized protein LOC121398794 [Xenopus laevis]
MEEYIKENLERGFIRPSSSPAGAGVFFVKKKDGTLRPCIDYRGLNKITVKNRYPLPLISELFDRVKGAVIFSKLDLRGAYNLIRIREGDEWKTAFNTRDGHYEYLVMPFGLCNAPAVFQELVNDIFRDLLGWFVVVYLDDILIFSSNLFSHRAHVREVLSRLRQNHLYAKLEKCLFEVSAVPFLGYIISQTGLEMEPTKVQAIQQWAQPLSLKAIQRFLGFANYYRQFILNFSKLVAPITALTKKGVDPSIWSAEAVEAFDLLKEAFISAPVLRHPDSSLPFIVEVDASEIGAGAVLSQQHPVSGKIHPCAFFSKRFSSAEVNYDIGNRELLAIKLAFEEWRHLLEGANKWAAPIVVVPKKVPIRLCGDYKVTVNCCLEPEPYPLPNAEDMFATLAGGKYFSKIDLSNAYQQLELDPDSKPYLTINKHTVLFQYQRLPFGESTAPAIFQHAMDQILQGIDHVVCFLDDILITGSSAEEHLALLDKVLSKLKASEVQDHGNADALSRLPCPHTTGVHEEGVVFQVSFAEELPISCKNIAAATSHDPLLSTVYYKIFKPYFEKRDELSIYQGCLLWEIRVVIPPKYQQRLLHELHEDHPGVNRMKAQACGYLWWPGRLWSPGTICHRRGPLTFDVQISNHHIHVHVDHLDPDKSVSLIPPSFSTMDFQVPVAPSQELPAANTSPSPNSKHASLLRD